MEKIANLKLNLKKYAAMAFSGVLTLTYCGCGADPVEVTFTPGASIVTDSTDNSVNETTDITDVSILEEDGTTAYYVTDELGKTSFLDASDVTTSGLVKDTDANKETSKTRRTTVEDSIDDIDIIDETTVIEDTTSYDETTIRERETTLGDDTTYNTTAYGTTTYGTTTNRDTTTTYRTTVGSTKKTTEGTKRTTESTKTTTDTTKTTSVTTKTKDSKSELYNACNSYSKFLSYTVDFHDDFISDGSSTFCFFTMPYGETMGVYEMSYFFAILNDGYIKDDILKRYFSEVSTFSMDDAMLFIQNTIYFQEYFDNRQGDFTKYTMDPEIGKYLNKIQAAYFNGTFDSFMEDQIVKGNIKDKYLNNAAVMIYMSSCDKKQKYLKRSDIVDNYYVPFFDNLSKIVYGHGYSKK